MKLSIVPSIRPRRAVSNGGPLSSVAYDLPCFMSFFQMFQTLLRKSTNEAVSSTIIQISSSCVEWWSSLSVAYELTCVMRFSERYESCLENARPSLSKVPSITSRRAASNGGPLLSAAYDLTSFIKFFERHKFCYPNLV